MTSRSSPTSARASASATLRMPSGSSAPEPGGVLVLGHAEQHDAAEPQRGRLGVRPCGPTRACAGRRRACSRSAGARERPRRRTSAAPAATAARASPHQPPHRRRLSAGDEDGQRETTRVLRPCAARTDASATASVTGSPASTNARRRAAPNSASASASSSTDGDSARTSTRRPCSSAVLAVAGTDARDDRRRVRLAGDADEVADRRRRGEQDRVELAGLDRLACRRRRRRGPDGAVGRDVVDLPAQIDQAGDEGLGRDVGARQEDPVDRVEQVVVRRPVLEQAACRTARPTA